MAIVRRNLVVMIAQGMRSDALSDARAWPLATHRLDQMAQRGIRLVASAASPAGGGAMASLLTGLHARQHGILQDTLTPAITDALPRWLADEGYHVVGVGCVDAIAEQCAQAVVVQDVASPEPAECAYMTDAASKGIASAITEQRRQRLRHGPFEPDRLLLEPEDDIDGFIATRAARVLDELPDDQPWAVVVVFSGPGNELPPPTLYDQVVRQSELRVGFVPTDMRRLDDLAEPDYPRAVLQRLEPGMIARVRSDYLGRVALVDHGVGKLVSAVSHRMDRERTWFMFGSDRGMLLGEQGVVGHRSFLAGAIETPMLVAPPLPARKPKEPGMDGLISTVDFATTAAALAGCDRPAESIGRSILPLYTGDPVDAQPRGGLVSEFGERVMLETERYKAVFDRKTGRVMGLFDLLDDPHEHKDLVGAPGSEEVITALRARLSLALLPLRTAI